MSDGNLYELFRTRFPADPGAVFERREPQESPTEQLTLGS